jgi:hypothetical protein
VVNPFPVRPRRHISQKHRRDGKISEANIPRLLKKHFADRSISQTHALHNLDYDFGHNGDGRFYLFVRFIFPGLSVLPLSDPVATAGYFWGLVPNNRTQVSRTTATRALETDRYPPTADDIGVDYGWTHSPLNFVGSPMSDRLYIVQENPEAPEDHLVLQNGSALVCSVTDETAAVATIAIDQGLNIRRHSELTTADQRRVSSALNRTP